MYFSHGDSDDGAENNESDGGNDGNGAENNESDGGNDGNGAENLSATRPTTPPDSDDDKHSGMKM